MFIGLEAQSFESCPQGGREIERAKKKGGVREEEKEMDGGRDQIKDKSKDYGSDEVLLD